MVVSLFGLSTTMDQTTTAKHHGDQKGRKKKITVTCNTITNYAGLLANHLAALQLEYLTTTLYYTQTFRHTELHKSVIAK